MPFGISKEGFWGQKELSYQHVHMFYGLWLSFIVFKISGLIVAPLFSGLFFGICMEAYQYRKYIAGLTMPSSWKDCIRDLCFWLLGGWLNYIILFWR